MEVVFIVDSTKIDISNANDLPLNITRRVSTIDNAPAGGFSKVSVTIPATGVNKSVFEKDASFKDCQIYVDGLLRFSGRCQARKGKTFADAYGSITENYQLNLYSDNSNWWLAVKDIDLGDVVTDTVELVNNEISDRFALDPVYTDNFRFGVIKRGQWSDNTTNNLLTYDRVKYIECTPLYYVKPLLVSAFNSAGYNVSSNFIDNADFKNLVIPCFQAKKFPQAYSEKYLNGTADKGAFTLTSSGMSAFDSVTQPQTGTPFSTSAASFYTAPAKGYYEVTIELEMPTSTPAFDIYNEGLLVIVAGVSSQAVGFSMGKPLAPLGTTQPYAQYKRTSKVFELDVADDLVIDFSSNVSIDIQSLKVTINGEAVYDYGNTLDFGSCFKGYKAGDFIKGLQHLFNLTFEVDEDLKVVTIEPDSMYLTTYDATEYNEGFYKEQTSGFKNYSKKIDYSLKGSFEYIDTPSLVNYTYKQDSEGSLDRVNSTDEIKCFDAQIAYDSGNGKTDTKENPFFAKTLQIRDIELIEEADRDTLQIPLIPLVTDEDYFENPLLEQSTTVPTPRILYFFGQNSQENGEIRFLGSSLVEQTAYCPLLFSVNTNDAVGNYPSLSFSDVGTIKGLLTRYYTQYIARRNDKMLRKNYVTLLTTDLLSFSFRNKIMIDAELYIVNKLAAYNPVKDEPVEFELIPDIQPDSDTLDLINHSIVKTHIEIV